MVTGANDSILWGNKRVARNYFCGKKSINKRNYLNNFTPDQNYL